MATFKYTTTWTHELCDCCGGEMGCNVCMYACCCQACAFGSMVHMSREDELLEPCDSRGVNCHCFFYLLGTICSYGSAHYALSFMQRGEIRRKLGIQGDACEDCLLITFCGLCSSVQTYKEIHAALKVQQLPAYAGPGAYAYPPLSYAPQPLGYGGYPSTYPTTTLRGTYEGARPEWRAGY